MIWTNLFLIFTFVAIYFVCDIIGYLTEKATRPWNYFDRYPFKCRKCCAVWTKIFAYICFNYLLAWNWFIFTLSVLAVIADIVFYTYTEYERGGRFSLKI